MLQILGNRWAIITHNDTSAIDVSIQCWRKSSMSPAAIWWINYVNNSSKICIHSKEAKETMRKYVGSVSIRHAALIFRIRASHWTNRSRMNDKNSQQWKLLLPLNWILIVSLLLVCLIDLSLDVMGSLTVLHGVLCRLLCAWVKEEPKI